MFYKIKLFSSIIITTISFFSFLSCTDKNSTINDLYFIGDSHVSRWDITFFFPEYVTYNMGLSGSKIDYIEQYKGYFNGKNVVIIIGTNDFSNAQIDFENYITRYCNALINLQASQIYLFSIFPNNNIENKWNDDNRVLLEKVNNSLKKIIQERYENIKYIDVYRDMLYNGYLNPEYYSDGLHLNENGYELITYRLKQVLCTKSL